MFSNNTKFVGSQTRADDWGHISILGQNGQTQTSQQYVCQEQGYLEHSTELTIPPDTYMRDESLSNIFTYQMEHVPAIQNKYDKSHSGEASELTEHGESLKKHAIKSVQIELDMFEVKMGRRLINNVITGNDQLELIKGKKGSYIRNKMITRQKDLLFISKSAFAYHAGKYVQLGGDDSNILKETEHFNVLQRELIRVKRLRSTWRPQNWVHFIKRKFKSFI